MSDRDPDARRTGWMAEGLTAAYRRGEAQHSPVFQRVLEHLGPERTVADIGAGVGRFAVPLARAGCRVWAVEPSEEMLERLRQHLGEAGVEDQVVVVPGSWPSVDVPPVEVALAGYVLQLAEDPVGFVAALDRLATRRVVMALHVDPIQIPEVVARWTGRPLVPPPQYAELVPHIRAAGVEPEIEIVEEDHRPPWEDPDGVRRWLARLGVPPNAPEAAELEQALLAHAHGGPHHRRSAILSWTPRSRG
ncbi:MAG: class I SAM-dependent methyltransferase [Firmicutes bacterium]|nr:methyltransferase domain-containing protein [Alicyclobacillaceae bacterium]MCL6496069.1 class I SAM-dependent methyltransferase [Bacillota bacterium]